MKDEEDVFKIGMHEYSKEDIEFFEIYDAFERLPASMIFSKLLEALLFMDENIKYHLEDILLYHEEQYPKSVLKYFLDDICYIQEYDEDVVIDIHSEDYNTQLNTLVRKIAPKIEMIDEDHFVITESVFNDTLDSEFKSYKTLEYNFLKNYDLKIPSSIIGEEWSIYKFINGAISRLVSEQLELDQVNNFIREGVKNEFVVF